MTSYGNNQDMADVPVQNDNQAQTYDQQNYAAQPAPAGGAGAGAQPSGSSRPTGLSGASLSFFVTSPMGILRLVELLFSMIAFGATSDNEGYDAHSQFEFVVAAGVLTFLWVLIDIPSLLWDLHNQYPIMKLVAFALDSLFAFFTFLAGIVAAAKCDEKVFNDIKLCDNNANKIKAGIAFSFLTSFVLMGSAFFSFKRWRA